MSRQPITTGVTSDATGLPTWTLADGSTVDRDAEGRLTIARPGREPIQGRMGATETHREAYDRLLELDGLRHAEPTVDADYGAAVTVDTEIDGQFVTLRVSVQLRRGAPEVLYVTGAEVRSGAIGALCVGDVLLASEVSEEVIAMVETALVEAWPELEAA